MVTSDAAPSGETADKNVGATPFTSWRSSVIIAGRGIVRSPAEVAMEARAKAGLILVYVAWAPMIAWQSLPSWGPKVLGEWRCKAILAAPVLDVISWVWFLGAFAAGWYLMLNPDVGSFFRRFRRKR